MVERFNDWKRRRLRDAERRRRERYYRSASPEDEQTRGEEYGAGYIGEGEFGSRTRYGEPYDVGPYEGRPYFGPFEYEERYGPPQARGSHVRSRRLDYIRGDEAARDFSFEQEPRHYYGEGDYEEGDSRYQERGFERPYGPRYGRGRPGTTWSYTESQLSPGPYTGVGPAGYQRSNERILEDVSEFFTQHGYLDPTDITIEVNDGVVTLHGTVDSRRSKRLAEDIAESVSGVWDVQNQLQIRRERPAQEDQGENSE